MVAVAACSNTNGSTSSISSAEVRDWLQKTPVYKGEKWFVVCAEWFSRFIGQFEELSDIQFSPKKHGNISPIDNSELLDENRRIKRDLIQDMHYRLIPEECWERLVSEYKMKNGQEPISVSIIQHGDALGPELYFYHVSLKRKTYDKQSEKSYSGTTTLLDIEREMREFFDLPRDKFPEARLSLQPMSDCEWIPIDDKSLSLMDTGASDSCVIMIDVETQNYPPEWNSVRTDLPVATRYDAAVNVTVNSSNLPSSSEHSNGGMVDHASTNGGPMDISTFNGENGVDSEPPADVYGPSTYQDYKENQARYDIGSINDSFPDSVTENSFGDTTSGPRTDAAIPLPYPGPFAPESGAIALPYGPIAQPESSYISSHVEEKSEPGVCGLRNLINSCYMNAALQCLSSVKPLSEFFLNDEWKEDINVSNTMGMEGKFATEYANLIKDLWSGNYKSISPYDMKRIVGQKDKHFMGSQQHDSHELMTTVLDALHEDLKRQPQSIDSTSNGETESSNSVEDQAEESKRKYRLREDSRIIDIFHGYQKSTVICSNCQNESKTYDPFNVLSLPLPGGNLCRLEITYVSNEHPERKPVRHTVEVDRNGTVEDLLVKVAEITKSDASRLWAAQVCNRKVNQHLESRLSILRIYEYQIYVYERPSSHCHRVNGREQDDDEAMDECSMVDGEIRVNGTGDSAENDKLVDAVQPVVVDMVDNVYGMSPFGQPIIYFPPKDVNSISVEDLTGHILRQGNRYIKRPTSKDECWWKDQSMATQSSNGLSSVASGTSTTSLPDLRRAENDTEQNGSTGAGEDVEEEPPMFTLQRIDEQGNRHPLQADTNISLQAEQIIRITAVWHRRAKIQFYDEFEANYVENANSSFLYSSSTKVSSLNECLDLFTCEDRLEGTDAVECTNCPKTEDGQLARFPATKKMDLWELPPVLILHLKRFSFMTHSAKLDVDVQIPVTDLSLQQWVKGPQQNCLYDLVAVSNHIGRKLENGHYTALAKNWKDGKWYRFNDDLVSEVVEPKIDGELAYILVYVKREMDDSTMKVDEDMEIA